MSGPAALLGFKLLSNFSTPVAEIVMCGIGGCGLGPLSGRGVVGSCVNVREHGGKLIVQHCCFGLVLTVFCAMTT